MTEILIASTLGGACSALRFHKSGPMQMFRVFLTSTFLAYFAGNDFAVFASVYFGYTLSSGASCFLMAYLGSTLIDRAVLFIRAYRVTKDGG